MEYRLADGILMIETGKEVDHYQAGMIIHLSESLIRQRRVNQVIFDMKDTVFMDSSGIGMLIGLYKEINVQNGSIGIINMQPAVRRIYQMSGLTRIVPYYESESMLLEAVKGRQNEE